MRLNLVFAHVYGSRAHSVRDMKHYYTFFLPYARRYWASYVWLFITLMLGVCMTLAYAWFLKGIMEAAIARDTSRISWMLGFGASFYFLNTLINFLNNYVRTITTNKLRRDLKATVFNHMTKLSQTSYTRYKSGDLLSRLNNDTEVAIGAIGTNLVNILRLPLTAGVAFVYLFGLNAKLALVLLCFGPIALTSATVFSRYIRMNGRKIQKQVGTIMSLVNEVFAGHALVRAFTLEKLFSNRYKDELQALVALQTSSAKLSGGFRIGAQIAGAAALLTTVGIGSYDVARSLMTAGALLAFISLMHHLIAPFTGMAREFGGLQRAIAAAERLWEILDSPIDVPTSPINGARPDVVKGPAALVLREVSFTYDGIRQAVDRINLTVPAGKIVAFVGPSGAGKSTLFQLMLKFYHLYSGEIWFNHESYASLSTTEVRERIAYVQQDPFLFSGSIRENILHGRLDATERDMHQAAKRANIHDFIMSLPEAYSTEVGEHGIKLSGGQKQRIALARALIKNAPVLILDEATSALDSASESYVRETLRELRGTTTTLVSAHRLSTIREADLIVVLDKGRIVAVGEHEDLLAQNGLYSYLVDLQDIRRGFEIGYRVHA